MLNQTEELKILKEVNNRLSKFNLDKNKTLANCYYKFNKRIKYLESKLMKGGLGL